MCFQDLPAAVSKVAEFLKIHLSRDTLQDIAEKCSFENLKAADEALKTRTDVVKSGLTENETKQRKNNGRSWVFRKGTDRLVTGFCIYDTESEAY